MFETRWTIVPTAQAMAAGHRQPDYDAVWDGLERHFRVLTPAATAPTSHVRRRLTQVSSATEPMITTPITIVCQNEETPARMSTFCRVAISSTPDHGARASCPSHRTGRPHR